MPAARRSPDGCSPAAQHAVRARRPPAAAGSDGCSARYFVFLARPARARRPPSVSARRATPQIDQVGLTGPVLGMTWAGRVPGPSVAIAAGLLQVSGPSGPGTTTATIPHKIP